MSKEHARELEVKVKEFPDAVDKYKRKKSWRARAGLRKRELFTYLVGGPKSLLSPCKGKFVVICVGRSGSMMLFDYLNSHPFIQCEQRAVESEVLDHPVLLPRFFVESRAALGSADFYGFKLMPGHITWGQTLEGQRFVQQLESNGWKFIGLKRRNIFRQALSFCIAYQSRLWHHTKEIEQTRGKCQKTHLDIEMLLQLMEWAEDTQAVCEQLVNSVPHLPLVYEEDLFTPEQQQATMRRVFEYLRLPPHDVQTQFTRASKNNFSDYIENADEMIEAVKKTRFAQFLDEN